MGSGLYNPLSRVHLKGRYYAGGYYSPLWASRVLVHVFRALVLSVVLCGVLTVLWLPCPGGGGGV